jgi:hypothetical protein
MYVSDHIHVIMCLYVCSVHHFFPQGYFSGTSQYQFIAETYIVLVLCILLLGLKYVHVHVSPTVYIKRQLPKLQWSDGV